METKYYTLFEPGEINHIGTIAVSSDEDIIDKVEMSCMAHFDDKVSVGPHLTDMFDAVRKAGSFKGNYQRFEVYVGDLGTDDGWDKEIAICRTWIY